MKKVFLIGAALVACLSAFLFGYMRGMKQGQMHAAREEVSVAISNLRMMSDGFTNVDPQLREYLKGRIYYVIGMKFYDPGYVSDGWDVGTVDTNFLKGVHYFKDPAFQPRTYREAVAK